MKPSARRQEILPKKRLSSPKLKQSRPKKEKSLARWGDGLFYIVNIVQNQDSRKKVVVQYEDKSQSTVLIKDILKECESGSSKCHNCGITSDETLVVCHNCERGYHPKCHKPAITAEEAEDFICRICVFASCAQPGGAKSSGYLGEKFKAMKRTFPYDERYLTWDAAHVSNVEQCYCYCGGPGVWYNKMLQCCKCRQWFHEACVHCIDEPLLTGDRFYMFACAACNEHEFVARIDMSWQDIAQVSLFHLIMTYGSRWIDLEDHLIPFIKSHLETFGLHRLLMDLGRHSQGLIIRQELMRVLNKPSLFNCGAETRYKKPLWFCQRERIPPSPPAFSVPLLGSLSIQAIEDIADKKTYIFNPVKFTTSVPFIFKGPHKIVPPSLKVKVKIHKFDLKSEAPQSRESTSKEEEPSCPEMEMTPSPTPPPSTDDIDDNNNNSPVKQEPITSSNRDSTSPVDLSKEIGQPIKQEVKDDGYEPSKATEHKMKEEEKKKEKVVSGWSLDRAIPFPTSFSGENHPFLTEYEQKSLQKQKQHFESTLIHLSKFSLPVTLFDTPLTPKATTPQSHNDPAKISNTESSSEMQSTLPELIDKKEPVIGCGVSPSKKTAAAGSSPKREILTQLDDTPKNSPGSRNKRKRSSTKNENSFRNSPGERKPPSMFKSSPRNGLKELPLTPESPQQQQHQNNGNITVDGKVIDDIEMKKLKALSKCLKSLSPSCGFKFPVLDKGHPATTVESTTGAIDGEKLTSESNSAALKSSVDIKKDDTNSDPILPPPSSPLSRPRGKKRTHAQTISNKSSSTQQGHNNKTSDTGQNSSGVSSGETVRRSNRSRKDVQRFEATLDNSFDGLARPAFIPPDTSMVGGYDVLGLRFTPDAQVHYLVSWAQ